MEAFPWAGRSYQALCPVNSRVVYQNPIRQDPIRKHEFNDKHRQTATYLTPQEGSPIRFHHQGHLGKSSPSSGERASCPFSPPTQNGRDARSPDRAILGETPRTQDGRRFASDVMTNRGQTPYASTNSAINIAKRQLISPRKRGLSPFGSAAAGFSSNRSAWRQETGVILEMLARFTNHHIPPKH